MHDDGALAVDGAARGVTGAEDFEVRAGEIGARDLRQRDVVSQEARLTISKRPAEPGSVALTVKGCGMRDGGWSRFG